MNNSTQETCRAFLERIAKLKYYTDMNAISSLDKSKWRRIEGKYSKPSECAAIIFKSSNRESPSWKCLQKTPSKKKSYSPYLQPAPPFTMVLR